MLFSGPYVHHLDPILGTISGVHLWWYGLSYSLGFLAAHQWLRKSRMLGLSVSEVYDLTLSLGFGVLLGGRAVEVVFYEWPFYRGHLALIPAVWLGGMSTHGLLAGGLLGIGTFCWIRKRAFLAVTDALVVPAALILGLGRLGNFVDGQIVGSLTSVPWAVKFPDAEGFRHPVVLYDGLKNLLLIPLLLGLRSQRLRTGRITGWFLFLYAFLRLFVDRFREYPTTLFGLATGQSLNLFMALIGLALVLWPLGQEGEVALASPATPEPPGPWRKLALALLLAFPVVIPSDWTQDIPVRYGKRHPGLVHSWLYPELTQAGPRPPVSSAPRPDSFPESRP